MQFKTNTEGARLTAELDDVRESIEECNGLADTLLAMIEQINQLAVELQTSQQSRQDAETNRQRQQERYHQQQELILQRNKLRDDLTRLEQEQRSTEQASQSQERLAEKIKSAMRDQQEIVLRRAELAKQLEAERGKLSAIDASKAKSSRNCNRSHVSQIFSMHADDSCVPSGNSRTLPSTSSA